MNRNNKLLLHFTRNRTYDNTERCDCEFLASYILILYILGGIKIVEESVLKKKIVPWNRTPTR